MSRVSLFSSLKRIATSHISRNVSLSCSNSVQFKNIVVQQTGKIYRITFNRPQKKNALTPEMYNEIVVAMKEAANGDSLLTVFTGSGDFYCSGNDLSNFAVDLSNIKQMAADARKLLQDYVAAYVEHPKPLVALVNGPAVGISVTVLGLFDLVYASDKAWFHTPFSNLGQSPEGISSSSFPQLMGLGKATEMLLFNKKLTPEEAHRLGLVTEVFPHQNFEKETTRRLTEYSELPPEPYIDHWRKVNETECSLIEGRWQSQECLTAIAKFFTRSKAS
uniref:Enoyl-CoA delta isomerase 2, mitochondrial n=1 Tax=Romanomermis culicivorax TaxID=13658 RepID=A0A915INP7_ROMCU